MEIKRVLPFEGGIVVETSNEEENEWKARGDARQREELKDPKLRAYLLKTKGEVYVKRMEKECELI